ncbi:[protein-PII] uridylyltransferase [Thermodesulfobacteriota bacterium]
MNISPAQELKETKTRLVSQLSEPGAISNFHEHHTEIIDQYFRRCLQESKVGPGLFKKGNPFAFVSVGGYGRMELCLHSDIDIMILFNSKIPPHAKELAEEVLYPLWDLGLDLGYGIRSLKDCVSLSKKDFEVLTSLLDARFLCGDSPLYLSLMQGIQKKVVSKKTVPFRRWLEDQSKVRMAMFGDASYLLEPDLKEGIGGLRDYHHILWLARVFFQLRAPRDLEYMGMLSHNEYQELEEQTGFILKARTRLHQLSGRRNDRLIFDYQEELAADLGYKDKKGFLAVEQFMGDLHSAMGAVKSLHQAFLISHLPPGKSAKITPSKELCKGLHLQRDEVTFHSATAILSNPFLMMDIFEQSARLDRPLSLEAKRLVREFTHLVDETYQASEKAAAKFLSIMEAPNAPMALDQMFETGFLGVYIPEMDRIKDRVQFDSYHIYPVGRHVLETVRYLKTLAREKDLLLLDVFSDLAAPASIFLAGLFHDIGKMGGNHSKRGVAITRGILKRLGYGKDAAQDILFLIRHHLLLVETATRRDLNDEKVIVQCARTIGSVERLKMLYLLTWADSSATGPRAWSEWIANLVQELFFKILHTLESGELATPNAARRAKHTLSRIRREMENEMESEDLENLIEIMSPRYLLETRPQDILDHIRMFQALVSKTEKQDAKAFTLTAVEKKSEGWWEITFLGRDRPGLFSALSGVLAIHNINILSAYIYTWRDGTALDRFIVTSPLDPIHSREIWEKIRNDLEMIFRGDFSLDKRLKQRARPSILSRSKKSFRRPDVRTDNVSSDFFTLIEIFASDRVGLLYEITRTLFELGLDIRIAKISTKTDQIADVFYVRDPDGQKIEDENQLKEIRDTLLPTLRG